MKKSLADNKKLLKQLNTQLTGLQEKLVVATKAAGVDENIYVKAGKRQARFQRIKAKGKKDKGVGKFFIEIDISAKVREVFIPISIATGKKTMGFMYHIEGTDEGTVSTARVECRGEKVTQVTLGTLLYARIPAGQTASCRIHVEINGRITETYKIIINRINYKLSLTDTSYNQYLKAIVSESVKFS